MKTCFIILLSFIFLSLNAQINGRTKPPANSIKTDTASKSISVIDTSGLQTDIVLRDSLRFVEEEGAIENNPEPCDTIFLMNKNVILARDIYFQFPDIVFTKVDSTVDVQRTLPKKQVRCIVYANGMVEVCNVRKIGVPNDYPMFQKGQSDAGKYYTHSGGSIGIGFSTFLTGGIIGVIPAAICSATTPKYKNLGIPLTAPYKNKDYVLGYTYRAKKIKQSKIWASYGIGFLGAVAAFVVLTK